MNEHVIKTTSSNIISTQNEGYFYIDDLSTKVDELEKVSGMSLKTLITAFKNGFVLSHPMSDVDKKLMSLTLRELSELVWNNDSSYIGNHIWVKDLRFGIVLACVLDAYADDGIVAVYGANDKEEWFFEKDYGKTWVAYLERPE